MNRPVFSVPRSLKRKLLLPLLLIGAALAAATVWGIYAKFQNQLAGKLRQRAELIANAVNYAAESVSRPGELQRIVSAIGAEEEVSLIVVAGGRPARVLASTRNAWLGKALTEVPVEDVAEDLGKAIQTRRSHNHLHLETAQFDFTSPLFLSRPELADRSLTDGAVMVHLDLRATQAAIWQLTREFSLAFLAALAVLAALGYGLLHHFVLRPVARIGKLVEQRREGAGGSWAAAATNDELGALARTLHDSLTRTEAALRELEAQRNALRASEDRFRSLVEESPDVIGIYQEGKLVFVNSTGAQLLGAKTKDELLGRGGEQLIHPDDLEAARDRMRRRLAGETGVYPTEVRYLRPDGTTLPAEVSAAPITFGGKPAVQFIARDITERKRAEQALRESRQTLRQILDTIPVRVFWKDRNLTYQGCNQSFALDSGFSSPEELSGKSDLEMKWNARAELYRADDRQVIESGRPKLGYEEPQTTPDGSGLLWLRTSKVPWRDADGQIRGVLGTYEDITERKQAEAVHARLVAILEASPDFVGYADARDGQILYINRSGRKMVGIGEHEDLSRFKIPDVHPEWANRQLREEILPAASREGFWSGECAFRHLDGREIPVWMVLQSHRSADGDVQVFSTVSHDITERKRMEKVQACLAQLAYKLSLLNNGRQAARLVADAAQDLLAWDACFLRLRSPDLARVQDIFDMDTVDGRRVEMPSTSQPGPPGPMEARVIRDGAQLLLRSSEADAAEGLVPFGNTGRRSASLLFVPLRHHGQHLGLFSIQSYRVGAYDRTALDLLQTLADHAAGALERIRAEQEREKLIGELKAVLAEVKTLSGLIPICAGCKKIRDDQNYWHQVDSYIAKHTDATFTHGMCPDCVKKWYPDLAEDGPLTQ